MTGLFASLGDRAIERVEAAVGDAFSLDVRIFEKDQAGRLRPFDLEGYSVTFTMALQSDATSKKIDAVSGTIDQQGNGVNAITGITLGTGTTTLTTDAAHGLSAGDRFRVDEIEGTGQLNGRYFVAASASGSTITINEDGRKLTAWSANGIVDTRGLLSFAFTSTHTDTAAKYWGFFTLTKGSTSYDVPVGKRFEVDVVASPAS